MAADPGPDPQGTIAWAQAVIETLKQAYLALILPAAAGIAWIVNKRGSRRQSVESRADAMRRAEEDRNQALADKLDKETLARLTELQAEVVALNAEINRLRALRLRWFDAAHAMRHEAGQMLQQVFSLMAQGGLAPPDLQLPPLAYDPDKP